MPGSLFFVSAIHKLFTKNIFQKGVFKIPLDSIAYLRSLKAVRKSEMQLVPNADTLFELFLGYFNYLLILFVMC